MDVQNKLQEQTLNSQLDIQGLPPAVTVQKLAMQSKSVVTTPSPNTGAESVSTKASAAVIGDSVVGGQLGALAAFFGLAGLSICHYKRGTFHQLPKSSGVSGSQHPTAPV